MRGPSQRKRLFGVERHSIGEEYNQLDQVEQKATAKTGDEQASKAQQRLR